MNRLFSVMAAFIMWMSIRFYDNKRPVNIVQSVCVTVKKRGLFWDAEDFHENQHARDSLRSHLTVKILSVMDYSPFSSQMVTLITQIISSCS